MAVSAGPDEAWWVPSELLPDEFGKYSTHKAKELMRALDLRSIDLRGLDVDTAIAAYLLDPAETQYLLEDLAVRYLGLDIRSPEAPPPGQLDLSGTAADPAEEAARRAVAIARLAPALGKAMESRGLHGCTTRSSARWCGCWPAWRRSACGSTSTSCAASTTAWWPRAGAWRRRSRSCAAAASWSTPPSSCAGCCSTSWVSSPRRRPRRASPPTRRRWRSCGAYPVIEPLLRYREVEKLRSTYGESLLGEVADDGRIHASFNQTVARTGRLSSDRPNLHNIPIRTEEGRRIRRAFIPAEGCRFLVADYNQIELRVIAHLAQDPGLIEAFASGRTSTRPPPPASSASTPRRSRSASGRRRRWSPTGWPTAWSRSAWATAGHPHRGGGGDLDAYFAAFPSVR